MARRGEVLVAILNNHRDMEILRSQRWYRIPVESVEQRLKQYWAPECLAFYQTKVFGNEAYAVRYYAHVLDIQEVARRELIPDEPECKNEARYYKLALAPLEQLPQPIISTRPQRLIFLPTTFQKLSTAVELKDLTS